MIHDAKEAFVSVFDIPFLIKISVTDKSGNLSVFVLNHKKNRWKSDKND